RRLCCLSHLPGFGVLTTAGLPADDAPASPPLKRYVAGPTLTSDASVNALARGTELALPGIALGVADLVCGLGRGSRRPPAPERRRAVVAEYFADLPTKDQPRQTLRETSRDLTRTVLMAIPTTEAVGPDSPVAGALAAVGVTTLEQVL